MNRAEETLPAHVKAGYALGDHSINVQLAATSLFYLFFLTEVAGLPPSLAGLVLLVGRAFDALTDPAMGRVSDRTRWRWGRRRPYFLIAALPFGLTFWALWWQMPVDGEAALFLAYVVAYVLNALCSTVLAVPYMALLPELALGYQERTSANTFRSVAVVLAILLTSVGFRATVELFGGGAQGWARTGALFGAWVALPWLVVYGVSWERPEFQRESRIGFVDGIRMMARHRAYRRLVGIFLSSRIAVDVVGAMLIFYFTYWLRRPDHFPLAMALMLLTVIASLPMWLRISRYADKRTIFVCGASWWIAVQLGILLVAPSHAPWVPLALIALAGIGYGVADMMPWSMLGDVIDADELESGERREGIHAGLFTFVRKLGGSIGVAVAGFVLELAGFAAGQQQPDSALLAIRGLTSLAPILFLALAIAVATGYPMSRARHAEVLERLRARADTGGAPAEQDRG